tara:strand:- start:472 stop:576 length:105 start_codon:yes stop_codon:yes gene_type:complete
MLIFQTVDKKQFSEAARVGALHETSTEAKEVQIE